MRTIRRSDMSPRVEMLPLIDVIFLLLTFFIYSLVLMVQARILPVQLTPLASGRQGEAAQIEAISIDRQGVLFFNREQVDWAGLHAHLQDIASRDPQPVLYLAMEASGDVDRGPTLLRLIEGVRQAGVENFALVGEAGEVEQEPLTP